MKIKIEGLNVEFKEVQEIIEMLDRVKTDLTHNNSTFLKFEFVNKQYKKDALDDIDRTIQVLKQIDIMLGTIK